MFQSPASTFRSTAWLSFTGCVFAHPKCQDGTRNVTCHGVCLCVPLYAKGKPSWLPVLTEVQDYQSITYRSGTLDTGPEASRRSSLGAPDVTGGNCGRRAPQLCARGLGSKTRHHQRHPESSWQQGAACKCAPGWDDGEMTTNSNILSRILMYWITLTTIYSLYRTHSTGLFDRPADADLWECHLLSGTGHLWGHEHPGSEHSP